MSAASQTKIFGIRVGIDPKILVGGLIVIAAVLFWVNSRSGEESVPPANTSPVVRTEATTVPTRADRSRAIVNRRQPKTNDRAVLRVRPIDPKNGDVDPTLRLELIARLQSVQKAEGGRSLFEIGAAAPTTASALPITHVPIIKPGPLPTNLPGSTASGYPSISVNIPLKYYGFVRPTDRKQSNRGLFLDGDNVVVASEGELVNKRYLVVELTPNSARMEDTTIKQGQVLAVVPVAMQQ